MALPLPASDRARFLVFLLVAAILLVSLFLVIRARQTANSQNVYEDCLARAQAQSGDQPGFRPEDVCQRPD